MMGFRGWTNSKRTYTDEAGGLVTTGAVARGVAQFTLADNTEPPDDAISPGEMALWLDPTPGATKLMVKAKDAQGTVRTGSVDLT